MQVDVSTKVYSDVEKSFDPVDAKAIPHMQVNVSTKIYSGVKNPLILWAQKRELSCFLLEQDQTLKFSFCDRIGNGPCSDGLNFSGSFLEDCWRICLGNFVSFSRSDWFTRIFDFLADNSLY